MYTTKIDLFVMEKRREEVEPALDDDDDERLDEELEETFPASDPIPWRHGDPPPKNANGSSGASDGCELGDRAGATG